MKKKYLTSLLSLALLAIGGGKTLAQTDVTETYIVNPGFEKSTAATTKITGGSNATNSKDYTDTGWKNAQTAAWSCSAVMSYTSDSTSLADVKAPTSDNAGNTGNALGISVGWSGTVTYQSASSFKLPEGTYKLKVNTYNANTSATYFKSLFGFVATNGTSYLSNATSFTSGSWTTDEVTFTLDAETEGVIQIGGTASNAGSGNQAKIFFDNITLTKEKEAEKEDTVIQNGTYYLYDSSSKTFLSRGCAWGTEASMDKYGIPVTATLSNGAYTLNPADWNVTVYINGANGIYTDQTTFSWSVEQSGDGYIIYNGENYLTHATGTLGEYVTKTTDKAAATVWTLMNATDRNAIIYNYPNENYANVAKAAGMTDVTADNFLTTLNKDNSTITAKEIAPTEYTFTQVSRNNASTASPRELYQGTGNFTYSATGLKQGVYKVTIPAFYRNGTNAWCVSKSADFAINSNAYILANGEQVRVKGWAEDRTSDTDPNSVTQANTAFTSGKYANEVYCYVGEDSTLSLTVAIPNYQSAGWGIFGTTTLTYYTSKATAYQAVLASAKETLESTDYANVTGEEKTNLSKVIEENSNVTSNYDDAIEALNSAVKTFTDAKAAYDSYAANHEAADAIATALGVTVSAPTTASAATTYFDNLNVAEYEAVNKGYGNDLTTQYDKAWTSNNFGSTKGQHWSGNGATTYPDSWSGSATTVTATKTVTLPAGKWVIKAAGRSSASASISLTADTTTVAFPSKGDTGYGIATNGAATFSADSTYTNDGKGRGWEWRFIPLAITEQQEVTITITANLNSNSWASFCDLTILADDATAQSLITGDEDYKKYQTVLASAKETLESTDYANVTGEEKTNLSKVIEENSNVTSNYDDAIEALNSAVKTFTDAKAAYDSYAANHEAADAIATALGVTVSAPTTASAATTYFDNLNVAEYEAVNKGYGNDLTTQYDKAWTSNNFGSTKGQHWSGNGATTYPDSWSGSATTVTATKTVTLPAGKWVIKAAGRSSASASISLTADTTTVAFPSKGDTGYGIATNGAATFSADSTYTNDGKGRGWEWRFIPLAITEQQEVTITITANLNSNSWASFCDLTILASDATAQTLIASDDDYKAMSTALATAEGKTLGFAKDEYTPYNNVEALQAIDAAKAINTEATNAKETITALTEKLGQWTANEDAVSIVYNGSYATVEDGANYPKGWTRTNNWGQMQTDSLTTAYYNQPGSLKYGDRTGYTMPLKANTLYKLTFQYASWEDNSNKGMSASVLSSDNEGLATKSFAANGKQWKTDDAFTTATAYFTTGAAANYVLTLANSGNTVITGVAITEESSMPLDESATTAPDALTAPATVTYDRSFKAGWNSIVLPFATTTSELGADEAVTFAGTEDTKIKFTTVTELEANKPYMVHFAEAKDGVTFANKTVSPTDELTTEDSGTQYDFVGSYVANNAPVAGDYIVVAKGIQKAKGGNAMKAFRAYFKAQGEEAAAKAMTIIIDGQDVTGIDAINFNDALQGNEPTFNLAGQRVGKSYKGIVIRNGKKTINK